MARPSKVDRLPDEVKEEIGRLRRHGRTVDEILLKLKELLPQEDQPSRSGLHRHIQRADALAQRAKVADAMADRIVGSLNDGGEDKIMRANAKLLGGAVFELLSASEDGEPVVLDPKDAKAISETLRNISTAKKNDADYVLKMRAEERRIAREQLEEEMRAKLQAAVGKGGFDQAAAEEARRIMGFA